MVIDTAEGEDCTTEEKETFSFMKAPEFTGNVTYPNLQEVNNALKDYRQSGYDGVTDQDQIEDNEGGEQEDIQFNNN